MSSVSKRKDKSGEYSQAMGKWEVKKDAAVRLLSLYDEIRPAIKEHERDSQDWQQVWRRNGYKQAVINIEFDL
ncbi:hypothetical protein CARUB_v10003205mg [Capsella rubella]|uniref:Uncharacterized protein n=1 Tax=Capsella rubella TaxID=81985 RepID=R0HC10_9BRAS|nr:hypothetical protein CARUB_v10003205mg [Capsella rubella]